MLKNNDISVEQVRYVQHTDFSFNFYDLENLVEHPSYIHSWGFDDKAMII
jgi:hypothetical protein